MDYNIEDLKILIVEDERQQLELLETFLLRIGFQNIIKSNSARKAIQLAKKHQPDLFIIDILMPGMTGGELREFLKHNPDTRDIPVIFISGLVSKPEEKKLGGHLVSGDIIIAKPFSINDIDAAIDKTLRKSFEEMELQVYPPE